MNNYSLIGNLGSDAQVRTENGSKFVSFSVADTDRWTDQQGNKHEETQWVSCALNGDGGNLLPYLTKGRLVYVQGTIRTRVYSSPKERKMVAGINLSVRRVELVGGQQDNFPKRLADASGALYDIFTAHYMRPEEVARVLNGAKQAEMYSERGGSYILDDLGFVYPVMTAQSGGSVGTEQATTGQQEQQQESVEIY